MLEMKLTNGNGLVKLPVPIITNQNIRVCLLPAYYDSMMCTCVLYAKEYAQLTLTQCARTLYSCIKRHCAGYFWAGIDKT